MWCCHWKGFGGLRICLPLVSMINQTGKWTMMIRQPEFVSEVMVVKALSDVQKKKKLAAIAQLRFEAYAEGRWTDLRILAPFSRRTHHCKMYEFIHENGHSLSGKHHEIYLSDIRS